jgi:hypothetical protein
VVQIRSEPQSREGAVILEVKNGAAVYKASVNHRGFNESEG